MSNSYFQFKHFRVEQARAAMKVTTDSCLFGAWAAKKIGELQNIRSVIDAGTGTGLLSLMIAQKNPDLLIDAIEIDSDAVSEAHDNVQRSQYSDRIKVRQADIRTVSAEKHDVFISNPPFFENDLQSGNIKRNAALHATELSLHELVECIHRVLNTGGHFFLLLAHRRMQEFENMVQHSKLKIIECVIVRQSVNHKPFRTIIHGSLTGKAIRRLESEIFIVDADKKYSVEFSALLQDYYLNL